MGTSTGFNFGGGTYQVNQLGAGDQSTLAVGNTVTLTNLFYGPGNSGTLSVDFVKSWTTAAGTFTETLTSFVANRLTPNALTLNLSGILTGPGGISQAAFAVLTANQAAQAINWSFTDTSFSAVATPLPAGFVLFVTGLAGVGLLGRRRRRNAATPAT